MSGRGDGNEIKGREDINERHEKKSTGEKSEIVKRRGVKEEKKKMKGVKEDYREKEGGGEKVRKMRNKD